MMFEKNLIKLFIISGLVSGLSCKTISHALSRSCEGECDNGKGKLIYHAERSKFNGTFKDGRPFGVGEFYVKAVDHTFKGNFVSNLNQDGMIVYRSEEYNYIGPIKNGKFNGLGFRVEPILSAGDKASIKIATEDEYEYWKSVKFQFGKFVNSVFVEGVEIIGGASGNISEGFKGKFINGKPSNFGETYGLGGHLDYKGSFKNGLKHGKGTKFDNQNRVILTGVWQDDKLDGPVSIFQYTEKSGKKFESWRGNYKNGERSGKATITNIIVTTQV